MISRKELSIGNWVKNRRGEPVRITGLTESVIDIIKLNGTHKTVSEEDIFPINVTPEFLTDNGWVLNDNFWHWYNIVGEDIFLKTYVDVFRKEVSPLDIWWGMTIIIEVHSDYTERVPVMYSQPQVRYIHQFQNQLSMMGIDKEIIVNKI